MGQMKTNRQRERLCRQRLSYRGNDRLGNHVAWRHSQRLERMAEKSTAKRAWQYNRASAYLATMCPVRAMIRVAIVTNVIMPVSHGLAMNRENPKIGAGMIRAVTSVCMMRAAAHREVDHDNRGSQYATQLGHARPCTPYNRHRQPYYSIFK
jgi:hypothetical protein